MSSLSCRTCDETGKVSYQGEWYRCLVCGGIGSVSTVCPDCNGTGHRYGAPCIKCGSEGSLARFMQNNLCPGCNGSGGLGSRVCGVCNGSGEGRWWTINWDLVYNKDAYKL